MTLLALAFAFEPNSSVWRSDLSGRWDGLEAADGKIYLQLSSPTSYVLDTRSSATFTVAESSPEGCGAHVMVHHTVSGPTLACYAGFVLGTVGRPDGETIVPDIVIDATHDIDGNGAIDIAGREKVHLYDGKTYQAWPYPEPQVEALMSQYIPLDDVTGDGKADLLFSYYTEERIVGYYYEFEAGHIALHPGGSQGFGDAIWSIDVDEPLYEAIALQLDDDPQLEILALLGDRISTISDYAGVIHPVRIDVDDDGEVSVHPFPPIPHGSTLCGNNCPAKLMSIGDVDNDGYDDVALALTQGGGSFPGEDGGQTITILTVANDFDTLRPLVSLRPDYGQDYTVAQLQAITADLNNDGRLDIAMSWNYSNDTSEVQVWFAPWLEADPVLPEPTGDTGIPTASSTADTAAIPTKQPSGPTEPDPKGCGCHATTSPPIAMWLALILTSLYRRNGVPPCSS